VKTKNAKPNLMRCMLSAILSGSLLVVVGGCESGANKATSCVKQVESLQKEKTELLGQIEQAGTENKQLKKRIRVLTGLRTGVKLENLPVVEKVKIHRYTGFYDKNGDGRKEKLIVYLQPIDQQGDIVKAAGAVDVQLWDLNREGGQARLAQWHIRPDELKKLWFATIITSLYRLTFDVAGKIEGIDGPLTVKVTFSDYLTGKVFEEQRVIKP